MSSATDTQPSDSTDLANWQTRKNPPGRQALTYRGGKYVQTLGRMLDNLPTQAVSVDADETAETTLPLATINTDEHHDWTVALLHAWAAVTQVLSFYQERIINEAYLRTAIEPRSILELARTVGYELQPGVAASTHLALTVVIGKDEPLRQVKIPPIAVQSIPAPGEQPQIFETSEEFVARSDWNALKPADEPAGTWRQPLRKDDKSIRLDGIQTGLLPGAAILILEDQTQSENVQPRWLFTTLKTVQTDPNRGYTQVTWDNELGIDWNGGPLRNPQVFVLRQQAGLWGYAQGGVYFSPNGQTSWSPISIGLPHIPVYSLRQSASGALFVGTAKGLYRSINHGESWQPLDVGLIQKEVFALTANEQGHLFAGTSDGGIYLSQDNGDNWRVMSGETVVIPPTGLAKLLPHPNPPLPKTIVRTLATSSHGKTSYVIAGTDSGVFLSNDQGKTWQATNRDLPKTDNKTGLTSVAAWALAVTTQGKGQVFAGTDAGVMHIRRKRSWLSFTAMVMIIGLLGAALLANTWSPLVSLEQSLADTPPQQILVFAAVALLIAVVTAVVTLGVQFVTRWLSQLPIFSLGMPVHALAIGTNGQLFAGTNKGIFRSNDSQDSNFIQQLLHHPASALLGDLARRWQPVNTGLTSQDVRALAVSPQAELLAGTQDGLIFHSNDNGTTWEKTSDGRALKSVRSARATADGRFVVGVPAASPVDKAWSYFQLTKGQIDLDRTYTGIARDSWVILKSDGPSFAPYHVRTAITVDSPEASKPGKFTRVEVEQAEGLATFDRTITTVLAQSEQVPVYTDVPVEKSILTLDRFVPGLKPDNKLIVSGKRMRLRLVNQANLNSQLVADDGFDSTPLTLGDLYQVVRVADTSQPDMKKWQLKDKNGFIGSTELPLDSISLRPAADNDETISELVVIRSVNDSPSHSTITLKAPLDNFYDRSTVTIYGNIVPATHGHTASNELLGTSDAMKTSQRFLLKQQPLTRTSAANTTGSTSSLSVQINGVTWDEVTYLYGEPRDHRAYMIRQDVKGNTLIIFGDDHEGAGIPSGIAQITATYRIGLGRAGNVPAGRLNLLQGVIAGAKGAVSEIKAVTNPVAASGGTDPETMDSARWRAPLPLHHLQRIVSLTDFEDFARTFAGIGKAKVSKLLAGSSQLLHLTIAGADGAEVPADSELYTNLVNAIETFRDVPTPPVQVASFKPLYFNVKATLIIESDQLSREDDIQAEANSALRAAFNFAAREFGQPVAAAEVIAILQGIRGVVAVELTRFYVRDVEPQLNTSLEAQLARSDKGEIRPAQMLLINRTPREGIILEIAS